MVEGCKGDPSNRCQAPSKVTSLRPLGFSFVNKRPITLISSSENNYFVQSVDTKLVLPALM